MRNGTGRRALGAMAAVLVVVGGCSDDGRELRPPRPDQTLSITTAPTTPTTTSALASTALTQISGSGASGSSTASSTTAPSTTAASLTLVTPWSTTGLIDPVYSCQGGDTSPPLSWTGVPSGSAELAVVVTDPDANGFVHWVLAGLDPNAPPSVGPGRVPPAAAQAENSFGRAGWNGPCPPTGERHTYETTLYVLHQASGVQPGQGAAAAIAAIQSAAVASTTVFGDFAPA